jgi:hypothetical protein
VEGEVRGQEVEIEFEADYDLPPFSGKAIRAK